MRQELLDFLKGNDSTIESIGWEPYLERFTAFDASDDECCEIGQMLLSAEDNDTISIIAGVMMLSQRAVFRPYLIKAIESVNQHRKARSAEALIRWRDSEAISIICQRPDILEAVGDRLPERVEPLALEGRLSTEHEDALLRLAAARLKCVERLDWNSTPWVDLLPKLKMTRPDIATELMRIWENHGAQDHTNRYTILLAMAAHPSPEYEPVFRKATKSKVVDLHDLGAKGLAALRTR
jgi:hypothetical protein